MEGTDSNGRAAPPASEIQIPSSSESANTRRKFIFATDLKVTMPRECLNILMPRESGKYIAQSAHDVSIKEEGIKNLVTEIVKNLQDGQLSANNFTQSVFHPNCKDPKAADWLLVLDTLNFCFWSDKENSPSWCVENESGYFALCAAVKRAIEAGIPITSAEYYSKITRKELQSILKADENSPEVPLIDERLANLHNVGDVLIKKYNGTFVNCIKSCEKSAEKLLKLIVSDFECFRDEANYMNQQVSFYKRAQILIGDIWACFEGKDIGEFNDIEYLTMFADYRVPQVLVYYGTMQYSNSLMKKLLSETNLPHGCKEELEIRGCSIEVIERVVKEVKSQLKNDSSDNVKEKDCNSMLVDYFLWDYRRKYHKELKSVPFHKVRTIFY